jgi:tetratricopeptide (TPR) repeat protein
MYELIHSLIGNKRFYASLGMVEKLVQQNVSKLDCEILFILESLKSEFVDSTSTVDAFCSRKIDSVCSALSDKVFSGDLNLLCTSLVERKKKIQLDLVIEHIGLETTLSQLDYDLKQRVFVLINRGREADFRNFDIDSTRNFSKYLESLGEHELACEAIQNVIEKMQNPFWDWYFKGEQFERLNSLPAALECFKEFLSIAISKRSDQGIQTGLIKVIKNIIVSDLNESSIKVLLASIPKDITYNEQALALLDEASEILEFRRLNQLENKNKGVGHHYLSEHNIKEFISKELEVIKVNPNFNSFYELSKAYAVIGEAKQAKDYLKIANDLNVFLFCNPSEIGTQNGNA